MKKYALSFAVPLCVLYLGFYFILLRFATSSGTTWSVALEGHAGFMANFAILLAFFVALGFPRGLSLLAKYAVVVGALTAMAIAWNLTQLRQNFLSLFNLVFWGAGLYALIVTRRKTAATR